MADIEDINEELHDTELMEEKQDPLNLEAIQFPG
jgi:hypothetical protein